MTSGNVWLDALFMFSFLIIFGCFFVTLFMVIGDSLMDRGKRKRKRKVERD